MEKRRVMSQVQSRLRIMIVIGAIIVAAVAVAPSIVLALADPSQPSTAAPNQPNTTDSDEPSASDSNEPITVPQDLERASSEALAHTGEGVVTDTEVGDEQSHYEVEVMLSDGSQIDVQLDEAFQVVGTEADGVGDEGASGD